MRRERHRVRTKAAARSKVSTYSHSGVAQLDIRLDRTEFASWVAMRERSQRLIDVWTVPKPNRRLTWTVYRPEGGGAAVVRPASLHVSEESVQGKASRWCYG